MNFVKNNPSSETISHSARYEVPHLWWNLKYHYHFHKIPPLGSILSHMNPLNKLTLYLLKVDFNIIFPFMSKQKYNSPQ